MSIQLAKNEKILKSFDYATEGYHKKTSKYDTFKSLIVTNKRLVHESVCERRVGGMIVRDEMPISHAKYISTAMHKISRPGFLVAAVIFAILAVVALVLPSLVALPEKVMDLIGSFLTLGGAALAAIAVIFLICYFASRKTLISCRISAERAPCPVMGFMSLSGEVLSDKKEEGKKKKKDHTKPKTLEIRVNATVAKQLADELGAVILDAMEYSEEEVEKTVSESFEEANDVEDVAEEDSEPETVEEPVAEEVVVETDAETVPEAETETEPEETQEV